MSDLVGSAVFEVDANISRFDAKLTEAQSRATAAVSGINSSLSKVQGMDVVINKVGTLNLSAEIGQCKAYERSLDSLRGKLAAVQASANRPLTLATGVPIPASALPVHAERSASEIQFLNSQVSASERELALVIESTTLKIKAAMASRVAAVKQWQAAMNAQNARATSGGYIPGLGESTGSTEIPPGLVNQQAKIKAISSQYMAPMDVYEKHVREQESAYAQSEANHKAHMGVTRGLDQGYLADLNQVATQERAIWEKKATTLQTISKQEEIALEAHNARMKMLAASGYQGMIMADRIYSPYTSGKTATPGVAQMDEEKALARAAANRKAVGAYGFTGTSAEKATKDITGASLSDVNKWGLEPLQQQLDPTGKAIARIGRSAKEAEAPVTDLGRSFGRLGRTLFAFVGVTAFVELAMGIYQAAAAGVEFNKTIENTRIGMAALLESEGVFKQGGNTLSGTESLNAALSTTDKIIKELQYDNLQTVATFEQLTKAYQSALAPGLAVGFSIDQIRKYTLGMVQAASAMQLPLDMLAEELRSMLRGTITPRNTIIATNLGITNEQIRSYKGDSQGLFDFVMGKLEKFKAYGPLMQNSFSGLYSNMVDMFSMVAGAAGAPFFDYLKGLMKDITDYFVIVNEKTGSITLNPAAINALKNFYELAKVTVEVFKNLAIAFALTFSGIGAAITKVRETLQPLLDKMDEVGKRSQYIAKQVSSLGVPGTYENEQSANTPLGLGSRYDLPEAKAKESSNTFTDNTKQIKDLVAESAIAKIGMDYLRKSGSDNVEMMAELAKRAYDADQSINELSKKMVTATEAAHENVLAGNAHLNSLSTISHAANQTAQSFAELAEAIHKAGGIDLSSLGNQLDDQLTKVQNKLKGLQDKTPGYGVSAKEKYEAAASGYLDAQQKIEETALNPQVAAEAFAKNKRDLDKARLLYQEELKLGKAEEDARLDKKSGGGGSAQPKSFTSTFDKIAREERKFQQETKSNWSEYWIEVFDSSGMFYEAAKLKTAKWYDDEQFKIEEASRKIKDEITSLEEKIASGEISKAGNMPGTQQKLSNLKAENVGLDEAKKLLDYRRQAREEQDEYMRLKAPEMWASENLELSKLVGTIQQQVYWENQLNSAKAGMSKEGKPPWMQNLIDQRTQIENQRNENLKGDDFGAGFKQAAFDAQQALPQMGQMGADAFKMLTDSISSAADALTELVTTGKMSFSDFANSIIKDIIRIMTQQLLMKAVMGGLNMLGLIGGGMTGSAGVLAGADQSWAGASLVPRSHDGTQNIRRMVPDSYFFNAPRLHNGLLASDEYPAILQKGEKVIPKNQSIGASSSVVVNITQNGGAGGMPEMQQLGEIVGKAVDAKVQENFSKQMKNGGLLDRRRAI